jgi:hypothetical protein
MIGEEVPAFPVYSGTEQLPFQLLRAIASRAWEKAEGDNAVFQRLCLQHVRGEIDLFADNPPETDASERVRADRLQQAFAAAGAAPPAETIEPIAPAAPRPEPDREE